MFNAWPQIFIRLFLIYNRQPRLAAQLRATGPGICTKLQTFVAKSRLPTDYLQAVRAWAVRNNSTWYIPFLVQLLTETFMRLYVMLHAEHNYKLFVAAAAVLKLPGHQSVIINADTELV